ncbi:hypothetical protein ACHAP5_006704 [Fusarium lateritium]
MAPKILLTGVTGTNLTVRKHAQPDIHSKDSLEELQRAKVIADKYPDVKFVYGDLESTDVIEKIAAKVDVVDIDRILNLPDEAIQKDIDKIVQNIDSDAVRFPIVASPVIYKVGKDLVNKNSITVPTLTEVTLDLGYALSSELEKQNGTPSMSKTLRIYS